jgi:hypothetical protein
LKALSAADRRREACRRAGVAPAQLSGIGAPRRRPSDAGADVIHGGVPRNQGNAIGVHAERHQFRLAVRD